MIKSWSSAMKKMDFKKQNENLKLRIWDKQQQQWNKQSPYIYFFAIIKEGYIDILSSMPLFNRQLYMVWLLHIRRKN